MHFKEDSERGCESKEEERERLGKEGESGRYLTGIQVQSQRHPYLPNEISNKFHMRHT